MREFFARHPRIARFTGEVGRFGSVGAIAYVVQLAITNLVWGTTDLPLMVGQVVGTSCAIAVAFIGNRFWTFADRARTGYGRETFLFLVMNGVGLLIQVGCLGFAVYVLDMQGPLASNIAGNVVGVGLGTLFRFFAYRTWVFPTRPGTEGPFDASEISGKDAAWFRDGRGSPRRDAQNGTRNGWRCGPVPRGGRRRAAPGTSTTPPGRR